MKKIVITGRDKELADALSREIGAFNGELSIEFSAPYSEDTLDNISFIQPDFVVCDLLSEEELDNVLYMCLDTTVVFITNDTNRIGALISDFNKKGQYNFINLDKSLINPKGVLESLKDYKKPEIDDTLTELTVEAIESGEVKTELGNLDEVIKKEDEEKTKTSEEVVIEAPTTTEPPKKELFIPERQNINSGLFSQSNVISVYSKKGGTGKSTIAKEIAYIFQSITLPQKMIDKTTLDVCLIDLDFEQGDLRTLLGIIKPAPNLFTLMDAIVTAMESGLPLNKIFFSAPEIKANYCLSVPNTNIKLLCLTQGDVPKKLAERIMAFNDDELLSKIIKRIIRMVRDAFNITIIDTSSSLNDINETVFLNSNKIIYVLEPNLTDLDNFKTFLAQTKESCYITPRIIPFLNKNVKHDFGQSYLELYEQLQRIHEELPSLDSQAFYEEECYTVNNNYGFLVTQSGRFKQSIIRVCAKILPVFRVKSINSDVKILERSKKIAERKRQKEASRKATEELKKKKFEKKKKEEEKKVKTINESEEVLKEAVVEEIKTDKIVESITEEEATKVKGNTLTQFLQSDLSEYDVDKFIEELKGFDDVKKASDGFPKVFNQPKTLPKKVWKAYYKQLVKHLSKK